MYRLFGKRILDILGAIFALIFLFPIMLVVSILIKIFDPGKVIFKQIRVGKDGKHFLFYKFRSMPENTGDIPSDQLGQIKISLIGKIIRRTNLDELPQLINIINGDMSFVGPRPPIPTQEQLILLRKQNGALDCRPGLTGLAQVNSYDGMSVEKKCIYDGEYSKSISLINDVKIVFKTFSYLLKPPPKY